MKHPQNNRAETVDFAIKNRRTKKVLSKVGSIEPLDIEAIRHVEEQIKSSILVAGFAPFHYDRKKDGLAEPWRMYWLNYKACRSLASDFASLAQNVKPNNKLPLMLNACSGLVLVTWLPESNVDNPEKLESINEEHLAAASAATQNLMLALEARGLGSYWSSGGQLREATMKQTLGINGDEKLIAAIFVDSQAMTNDNNVERIGGKNHAKRSPDHRWLREIAYPSE